MNKFNQPLGGNEMPRFGGPATMMRLPAQDSAEGLDACFVGIPMDIGASNRAHSVGHTVMRNLLQGGFDGPVMLTDRAARSDCETRSRRRSERRPDTPRTR